ncbi:MAG: FtsX-like permease family protein [Acidimicrobiia bacterium]|nr:FtsX-like permease family protein [Acidimicrobiia bacterium]
MIRLTIRNIVAHKARLAMTTLAVVLGVSFVVASFVLSDGLRSTFNDLSEEITAGIDLEVRPTSDFGEPLPLDIALVDEIAALDGVNNAVGFVEADENSVQPVKADGTTISTTGPPQLMGGWIDDPALSSFTIVDGTAPDELGEFSMDRDAAARNGFVVGQSYDLITPLGVMEGFDLVATTSFGDNNTTVGATLMHVSLDQAQTLFGTAGTVDSIGVDAEPAADLTAVTGDIQSLVGNTGAEVIDNATLTAEQQAEFNEGITLVGNVLLGFAIVSLFVSIFIIYNTFAIVLGQRIREMALLRAIGAEARQLRRSVLGEALAVGAVASAIGLGTGIALAQGLTALFAALGAELPSYPVILGPRTIVIAVVLGVGATVASSILPARAAASVPPIAGMRDGATVSGSTRRRLGFGILLLTAGLTTGSYALFGPSLPTLGLVAALGSAAVAVFVGITLTSRVVARPLTAVLGWPLGQMMGPVGDLATGNAGRNPRRTATTAAALMVGLSLVTTGYVVGESVKSSVGQLLDESISADYFIGDSNESGFSAAVADDLLSSGQFAALTGERVDEVRIGSRVSELSAVDLEALDQMIDLDVRAGFIPDRDATNVIVVHQDLAAELGVEVGDAIAVEFVSGFTASLEVAAIRANGAMFPRPLVPDQVFDDAGASTTDVFVAAVLPDGVTTEQVAPLIEELQATYPQISIDTPSEVKDQVNSEIDGALLVLNALLALAVIIALIGIANTLALSVYERTRELGLLRAVGMTRRQTRRMLRWEAVLVALFGAALGVATGVVFGWGAVSALPDDTFGATVTVPVVQLGVLVALATVATLVAAWLPARRAGRLNVLDAISQ